MIDCRDFDARLPDYVGRSLGIRGWIACWVHSQLCGACRQYMSCYRATISIVRAACEATDDDHQEAVPEELIRMTSLSIAKSLPRVPEGGIGVDSDTKRHL